MRKLSPAETACLLAILIIFGIGCEKSKRQVSDVDTSMFITEHSRIPDIDTTAVMCEVGRISIRRVEWILSAQQHLGLLSGKEYDRYFHYAKKIQDAYSDSILDLYHSIGRHELDNIKR